MTRLKSRGMARSAGEPHVGLEGVEVRLGDVKRKHLLRSTRRDDVLRKPPGGIFELLVGHRRGPVRPGQIEDRERAGDRGRAIRIMAFPAGRSQGGARSLAEGEALARAAPRVGLRLGVAAARAGTVAADEREHQRDREVPDHRRGPRRPVPRSPSSRSNLMGRP